MSFSHVPRAAGVTTRAGSVLQGAAIRNAAARAGAPRPGAGAAGRRIGEPMKIQCKEELKIGHKK
ncbi:MAG: hypothetical protein Kow0058_00180 [Roseovarius sp.]